MGEVKIALDTLRAVPGLGSLVNHFVPEFEPSEEEKELMDKYGIVLSLLDKFDGQCPETVLALGYFLKHYGAKHAEDYFMKFVQDAESSKLIQCQCDENDADLVSLTWQGRQLVRHYSKTRD